MPFWHLLFKNVTLRLVGSDDLPEPAQRAAIADVTDCLESGQLRPRISRRFPLDRIAEGHDLVEYGRSLGHVVLDVTQD